MSVQEEVIDFLETKSAGFADQEEAETIVDQEKKTIFEQEESHFSEVEEIVAEMNRLERWFESTTILKPTDIASESDSDSSSSGSSSDSYSDSDSNSDIFSDQFSDSDSEYSTGSMKDSVTSGHQTLKWGGDKARYFLAKFQGLDDVQWCTQIQL